MKRTCVLLTLPLAMLVIAAGPAGTAPLPCSAGPIRVWGDGADRQVIEMLQTVYRARHPAACFTNSLHGPESAIAGVYTGVADIAFMAREIREPMERMAYEWARLQTPHIVSFARGGMDANRPGAQLAVVVNPANPVRSLSLTELDAMLGAERLRGAAAIRRWGDAGATGPFGSRPVALYGLEFADPSMLFVRRHVMKDSRKWNPEYRILADYRAVVDAVSNDPAGIAVVAVGAIDDRVHVLALSEAPGMPAALPQQAAIVAGTYPLARTVGIVVERDKGGYLKPEVRAFLAFVLGPEGQAAIARSDTHLPLAPNQAAAVLEKLL